MKRFNTNALHNALNVFVGLTLTGRFGMISTLLIFLIPLDGRDGQPFLLAQIVSGAFLRQNRFWGLAQRAMVVPLQPFHRTRLLPISQLAIVEAGGTLALRESSALRIECGLHHHR
jgi:hypothetical protein